MTRSRVLILGLNYAPEHTGIAPYTAGMARGLSSEYDVQVVTTHPHYPSWQISDNYGAWQHDDRDAAVAVRRLRHYVPTNPTGPTRVLSEVSFAARLLAAHVQRPDVVITVSPALLPVFSARALATRWGVPLGVVVQDLYSRAMVELGLLGNRSGGPAARLESLALRRADALVAIHERFARSMVDRLGVDPDRITVIQNWNHVEPPSGDRDEMRRRLGWGNETVLLHAGNMGAKQGLEHVVEAAELAGHMKKRLRIVLMGDGNQRSYLEERARGVSGIDIVDGVPEAEFTDVLAAADVLLVHERPGLAEMSVPSKLTSYFAAGRPVLAASSAGSAAAHEINASGAGVIVEPGDPKALLEAVDGLLGQTLLRELGRRGQAYARERLSEDTALEAYRAWVQRLLKGSASLGPPAG